MKIDLALTAHNLRMAIDAAERALDKLGDADHQAGDQQYTKKQLSKTALYALRAMMHAGLERGQGLALLAMADPDFALIVDAPKRTPSTN